MTARPTAAAVGAILAAAALTACGATPAGDGQGPPDGRGPTSAPPSTSAPEAQPLPSGSSGVPRPGLPDPGKVKNTPTAVSRAALTTMWTTDTRIDVSLHDASVRASEYMTPQYAKQIKDTPPRSAPGAEWTTWDAHRAYTTVALTPADDAGTPPDTTSEAYRTWSVTITPHGADGWTGDTDSATAFVQLVNSRGWKVNAVQVQ